MAYASLAAATHLTVELSDRRVMDARQLCLEDTRLDGACSMAYLGLVRGVKEYGPASVTLPNGWVMSGPRLLTEVWRCEDVHLPSLMGGMAESGYLPEGDMVELPDGRKLDRKGLALKSFKRGARMSVYVALGDILREGETVLLPDGTTVSQAQAAAEYKRPEELMHA